MAGPLTVFINWSKRKREQRLRKVKLKPTYFGMEYHRALSYNPHLIAFRIFLPHSHHLQSLYCILEHKTENINYKNLTSQRNQNTC